MSRKYTRTVAAGRAPARRRRALALRLPAIGISMVLSLT
jgi:hypothetical protein